VIIAAADAAETLPRALDAIEAQDYQGTIEVVVAAADLGSARVAEGRSLVVANPTGRTPVALNLAARSSHGEVLVRIDAHSVVPPDYVSRLVATLERTGADNVGGMQVPTGATFKEKAIAVAMSSPFGAGDARYRIGGSSGPTDTVYLGAFRRSLFDRLGGYDEQFTRHQDYELNHRIRAQGGTVWFEPHVRVEYRPRSSFTALARQYFEYGRWKRRFGRTHAGAMRPRQWAPPLLVLGLLASLIGAIWWTWLLWLPAAYVVGLILAGVSTVPSAGPAAAAVPVALATMHVSWGIGFLTG
jgi:glycosyltransferase involved in cell wall biosynthesis